MYHKIKRTIHSSFQSVRGILFLSAGLALGICCCASQATEPDLPPKPVDPNRRLTTRVLDVSCSEAWMQVTTSGVSHFPVSAPLFVNNSFRKNLTLDSPESIQFIDSLLPGSNCTFRLELQPLLNADTPASISTAKTLDTSVVSFSWQDFRINNHYSYFSDVAVVNRQSVWATGEIFMPDTATGRLETDPHNLMHWDGNTWNIIKLVMQNECTGLYSPPLLSLLAFSDTDIVVAGIGFVGFYNGKTVTTDCRVNRKIKGAIGHTWGKSSSDFYVCGDSGTLVHYNGKDWEAVDIGSRKRMYSLFGAPVPGTGAYEIVGAACYMIDRYPWELDVFTVQGNSVSNWQPPIEDPQIVANWFIPGRKYYFAGEGVWQKVPGQPWNRLTYPPPNACHTILGTGYQDIYVSGGGGYLWHFNGYRWHNFPELSAIENLGFGPMSYKDGILAVAIGSVEHPGVLLGFKH